MSYRSLQTPVHTQGDVLINLVVSIFLRVLHDISGARLRKLRVPDLSAGRAGSRQDTHANKEGKERTQASTCEFFDLLSLRQQDCLLLRRHTVRPQ